jgi:hypothetical protein
MRFLKQYGTFSFVLIMMLIKPAYTGWWPFSQDNEKASVNVYFYYPHGEEVYLGQVTGISQCQKTASQFALYKSIKKSEWDYICCTVKKGSSCYEKLR